MSEPRPDLERYDDADFDDPEAYERAVDALERNLEIDWDVRIGPGVGDRPAAGPDTPGHPGTARRRR